MTEPTADDESALMKQLAGALEVALRAAEARGKVQGLRDALELVQFEICALQSSLSSLWWPEFGPARFKTGHCGHESCSVALSLYRKIKKAADAIEQEPTP